MPRGDYRKLTPEQISEIIHRYTTILPDGTWEGTTSLAKYLGVTTGTITYVLRKNGVRRRSAKESHSNGKRCKPVKNIPAGDPPYCKCGCGISTRWNRRKNHWNAYAEGHYRNSKPYKNEIWLRTEYSDKNRAISSIAAEFLVSNSTIGKFLDKFGIERQPVNHMLKGSRGSRNGSWKGGIAKVSYSPDWRVVRRSIKNRDKWTCQDCGEMRTRWGIYLHVHHIDENKFNNDPNNLISLCARCHSIRHSKEK